MQFSPRCYWTTSSWTTTIAACGPTFHGHHLLCDNMFFLQPVLLTAAVIGRMLSGTSYSDALHFKSTGYNSSYGGLSSAGHGKVCLRLPAIYWHSTLSKPTSSCSQEPPGASRESTTTDIYQPPSDLSSLPGCPIYINI